MLDTSHILDLTPSHPPGTQFPNPLLSRHAVLTAVSKAACSAPSLIAIHLIIMYSDLVSFMPGLPFGYLSQSMPSATTVQSFL